MRDSIMEFAELGLSQPLLRAIGAEGYHTPTPIQAKAIPHVLAGRDIFGCAQTGTGKTAAFALPVLDRLSKGASAPGKRVIRTLVLTPTRELASQIGESFGTYGRHLPLRHEVIFGGVGIGRQITALARGTDILIATPGRLLDLMGQRAVSLADVQILILDEADRMLDMGFIHDVKRIVKTLPTARQTLLFSATLPESIRSLAGSMLQSPIHVSVTPNSTAAETLDQSVYFVDKADKRKLLAWVLRDPSIDRTLAFTRTKHAANRVAEYLEKSGVAAAAIHGNKSQSARERALAAFKRGQLRVLVATDIAARGIDIDQLSYVINFDLPNLPETYVHRIGRSGRAGAAGSALSFCDREERPYLRSIERLIQSPIRVVSDHPHAPQGQESERPAAPSAAREPPRRAPQQQESERPGARERRRGPPRRAPQQRERSRAQHDNVQPLPLRAAATGAGTPAAVGATSPSTRPAPPAKPGYSPPRRGARTRLGSSAGRR
jgi:ATP-dependent RNA helicase RhlE